MSDKFTASNGVEIYHDTEGYLHMDRPGISDWLLIVHEAALREFFLHERDRELGRWRSPNFPEYVCYGNHKYVKIVNERTGKSVRWTRGGVRGTYFSEYGKEVALEYFKTHPEPPWHEAWPGEVWLIDIGDGEEPAIVVDDEGNPCFQFGDSAGDPSRVGTKHPDIRSGSRLWPEVDETGE